ncbi:MAG TPA: hypothetical protein VFM88_04520 [Vicinamibacteria bacterium]|nr:hypothetical protein [Vicinamibacteria bacterium]
MPGSVRCPKCGLVQMPKGPNCKACGKPLTATAAAASRDSVAPAAAASPPLPRGDQALDPAFDRDRFLLRQRALSLHEKYVVWDEQGQPILFVERPAHHLKSLVGLVGGLGAAALVAAPFVWAGMHFDAPLVFIAGLVLALPALVVVATALGPKRHVHFYRDESRAEKLLEVLQDRKFYVLTYTYTVNDAQGRPLARLSKNLLTDLLRKKWTCDAPDGRRLCVAREDSVLRAILRRFVSNLFVMNFVFLRGDTEEEIGRFNRKFTLLDRYVLDLSPDPARTLDRRVALALGVMLDTGERR